LNWSEIIHFDTFEGTPEPDETLRFANSY